MEPPAEAEAVAVAAVAEAVVAEAVVTEEKVEEPPTPAHKPVTKVEVIERPVPTLDADFWAGMLTTKREMDKAAKSLRYSNLVVLK